MTDHVCANEPCTCQMGDGDGMIGDDFERFCSPGCKDGGGCDCPKCGCNMDSVSGSEGSEIPMI